MRSLLRLTGWGMAAATALLLAVLSAHSNSGQQRLTVAVAALTGKSTTQVAKTDIPNAAQLARLAATEAEIRRLAETARALSADRERLVTRVAVLERNLEDVTGSIKRQAAVPPPASSAGNDAPALTAPTTAAAEQNVQVTEPAAAEPSSQPPNRVASVAASSDGPETEIPPPEPALGIDVGGATNFDGLRVLWNSVTSANASLFDGLHAAVNVRENSKNRAADLRLVAGPLPNAEAAGKICATLTAAKRYCRPVVFEGQPLALVAPEPPRRPKAAPDRKAQPSRPPVFPNP